MDTKEILKSMNERPIAYQPIYAKITGSVTAGILLSQILYWWSTMNEKEFYKTDESWCEELSFGLKELKNAKEKIKQTEIVEIERKGNPAKTHYTVNDEILLKRITSYAERAQQDMPKGNNKLCRKGTTIYTEITTKNTTDTSCEPKGSHVMILKPKEDNPLGGIVNEHIKLFEPVNPLFKKLYVNRSERSAMQDLIESVPKSQLQWMLANIEKLNATPYMPGFTKPTEMSRNIGKIINCVKKEWGPKMREEEIACVNQQADDKQISEEEAIKLIKAINKKYNV